jgi:hypothetical protein
VGGPPPPAASWAPAAWPTTNAPTWSSSAPVSSWAVQPPTPAQPQVAPGPFGPWDQPTLAAAFNTMTLTPPQGEWYMDSGATAHMASTSGILTHYQLPSSSTPSSIIVGDGTSLPIVSTGSTNVGPLHLNNVLVSPSIIKNLVSVRQFTIDNNCSVEFDPAGFSVKDLSTRSVIARCNSSGDLYPLFATPPQALLTSASSQLWHRRLGHIGHDALRHLTSSSSISCNKGPTASDICHACQLGRHVRLPFSVSQSRALSNFDLIHCDLWTSPIPSASGYKYYLVILDDCSHFLWTFPLRLKSDTFPTIANFFHCSHSVWHHH